MSSNNNSFQCLIVMENSDISSYLVNRLKNKHINVHIATTYTEALKIAKKYIIQLAIIDIDMYGEVCGIASTQILQYRYQIKIFLMSQYTDDEAINIISNLSPEYFLTKPIKITDIAIATDILISKFNIEKLENNYANIRIKKEVTQIILERYRVSLIENKLYLDDYFEVNLTKKEYRLIELFFKYPYQIISYQTIDDYVWKDREMNKNSLINLIGSLRVKLAYIRIITVNGSGYCLEE